MLYAKQDIDKNKVKIINDKEYYFDANPLKKEFGNRRIPVDDVWQSSASG